MNQSEKQLQKAILDYIKSVPGCKAVKVMAANERGTPDILACIGGCFWAIEVKALKGRLSAIQRAQLDEWESVGAITIIARSLSDIKQAMELIDYAK